MEVDQEIIKVNEQNLFSSVGLQQKVSEGIY